MYKIPLTNSPNQTFGVTVPVNGGNVDFTIVLNYNETAEYWSMTLSLSESGTVVFSQIPLLTSFSGFSNIALQFKYKRLGSIYVCPVNETKESRPNGENLGTSYVLLWGDNEL